MGCGCWLTNIHTTYTIHSIITYQSGNGIPYMTTYSGCAGNPFYREMVFECLVDEELRKTLFSWTKNNPKCPASNFTFTIDLWSEHLCFIMACDCDSVTPPMAAMTFYISCLHPFGHCWPAKCEGIFQKHGNGSNSQRISFSLKTH